MQAADLHAAPTGRGGERVQLVRAEVGVCLQSLEPEAAVLVEERVGVAARTVPGRRQADRFGHASDCSGFACARGCFGPLRRGNMASTAIADTPVMTQKIGS